MTVEARLSQQPSSRDLTISAFADHEALLTERLTALHVEILTYRAALHAAVDALSIVMRDLTSSRDALSAQREELRRERAGYQALRAAVAAQHDEATP